jgi:hypothetical protein
VDVATGVHGQRRRKRPAAYETRVGIAESKQEQNAASTILARSGAS